MQIEHGGLVVVADGQKMLLLRNRGDPRHLDLGVVRVEEQDNPRDRDQKSDAPGRAFASVGKNRSAYDEPNYHMIEEERFAERVAGLMHRYVRDDASTTFVVIAPPDTLGQLRKNYSKDLEAHMVGEIGKDLTNHPVPEIENVLSGQHP